MRLLDAYRISGEIISWITIIHHGIINNNIYCISLMRFKIPSSASPELLRQ